LKTVLIGFGDIAPKHLEVLRKSDCEVCGIKTRNLQKAKLNIKEFGIPKAYESLEEIHQDDIDFITILVSPNNNAEILKQVLPLKKPIFIEKPVTFSSSELEEIIELNKKYNCPIMVAMNRRFYSIFNKGMEFLKEQDRKINSIIIDAPERFSDINLPKFSDIVRKNWMFCNPIHCIDLIRFFGGDVNKIHTNSNHNKHVYSAIGHCEKDVDFSYTSNWTSPGRWSVTILADDIRIVYRPLEKGTIFEKNNVKEISPSNDDIQFKPGFISQLKFFLRNIEQKKDFVWPSSSLVDHKKTLQLIEHIYGINK